VHTEIYIEIISKVKKHKKHLFLEAQRILMKLKFLCC